MTSAADHRGFVGEVLFAVSGLLIWVAHFLVVYVLTAVICARASERVAAVGPALVPPAIAAATTASVGAIVALVIFDRRRTRAASPVQRFLGWLTTASAGIGLIAVLWEALPAAILPPC
jgi:hypothetical protein